MIGLELGEMEMGKMLVVGLTEAGRRATKARPHGFICSNLQVQQCFVMLPKAMPQWYLPATQRAVSQVRVI